uniref:Fibrinogen C-terminal domain-containing protein n=1 Tax=Amphimedon queenslandica TaxID=400682 RepID=A0A1X7UCF9_AMPQE
MDKENVYEGTELQQYDVNTGYEYNELDRKSKEQFFVVKEKVCCALIVVAVVTLMTLFLILALLLAVFVTVEEGYGKTSSSTGQSVEGTNCPSTTDVPSTATSLPNCSIVYNEWTNRMQQEMNELKARVNTLVNASVDTAWKIDDIHNFADMQTEKGINNSININKILETTGNSASKLINIVNTLSNLQDTCTSTAAVADDILLIAQELLVLHNDSTALPTSCKEIKERQPLSPSGVYQLAYTNTEGATYSTYCNMGLLCGSGGGWTRLAYLDMSDATQNCPSGFRLYQSGGVRACGRTTNGPGCISVTYPTNISYSQICGRVTGYQYFSSDAFNHAPHNNINSPYVDGVSITRGSPRQHVWTFANDPTDLYTGANPAWMCPCVSGSAQTVPSFVGNHYYCESGNQASSWSPILYTSDPLWDGQNCGTIDTCCTGSSIPWFHRDYGSTTITDYIELRVCGDEAISNEDSPVGFYEIYVQ